MRRIAGVVSHVTAPLAAPPHARAAGEQGGTATAAITGGGVDTYGTRWAVSADGLRVYVSPQREAPLKFLGDDAEWRPVAVPDSQSPFVGVTPDEAGFIWLASRTGDVWVMSPRAAGSGPVEAGVGHTGEPAPNEANPEWRSCPDAAKLIQRLLPLRGVARSQADAPAVVLIGATWNQELIVQPNGEPLVGYPSSPPGAPHWEEIGRLPAGNHDLFAAELDGDLWLSGGLTIAGFPAHNYCFDELWRLRVATGQWEVASHMPSPRNYNGLVSFQGELWVVGGVSNLERPHVPECWRDSSVTQPLSSVLIYSRHNDHWRDGPSMRHCSPRPYSGGPVVVVSGGRIWALATGWTGEPGTSAETVESIGVGETEWRQEAPLPTTSGGGMWCSGAAGCCVDDVIYVCAEPGFVALDTRTGTYDTSLPQHPYAEDPTQDRGLTPRGPLSAAVTAHHSEVWVLGGAGIKHCDCYIYNPKARGWRAGPALPTPQAWAGSWSVGGSLYLLSGGHKMKYHPNPFAGEGGAATHYDDRCWKLAD